MPEKIIDLRSDTVTRPTPAMRAAMAAAEVDDDVVGADPTVARLQERIAEMLGKEAAIYMPSGTMTNQVAVRLHCSPGDELICEEGCHIFNYEQAGYAQLSGIAARPVRGEFGVLRLADVDQLIRGDDEHLARTRLLCLENTHNRGAGRVLPYDGVVELTAWAHGHGLATHLDGARLFNAVVATGIAASEWAQYFDTVSVCFSKGLGARSAQRWPAPASRSPSLAGIANSSAAACGKRASSPPGRCMRWNITSSDWRKITPTLKPSPTPFAGQTG